MLDNTILKLFFHFKGVNSVSKVIFAFIKNTVDQNPVHSPLRLNLFCKNALNQHKWVSKHKFTQRNVAKVIMRQLFQLYLTRLDSLENLTEIH